MSTQIAKIAYNAQIPKSETKYQIDPCGLRRKFPLPTEFIITLTHKCNLVCDMCTQYGGDFKNNKVVDLPAQEWEKFMASIAWVRPNIVLFGGEPLIYPEIRKIFAAVHRYDCPTGIVTNGYFLVDYLEDIANYNIALQISIDGTHEVHNGIRNSKKSFDRIVRALEQIRQYNEKGRAITWSVNFVILPDNVDNILDFLAFIAEFKPSQVFLQHIQYSSPQLNELTDSVWRKHMGISYQARLFPKKKYHFDEAYLRRLSQVMIKVKRDFCSQMNISFLPDLSYNDLPLYYSEHDHFMIQPGRICTKPWQNPTINPNGDVLLCLDNPIGNITEDNFWTIWGNQKAHEFRQTLTVLERFPVCTRCCFLYENIDEAVSDHENGDFRLAIDQPLASERASRLPVGVIDVHV